MQNMHHQMVDDMLIEACVIYLVDGNINMSIC